MFRSEDPWGTHCFAGGQGDYALRLAFSYQPEERILSSIQVIGEHLHKLMDQR